MRTDVRASARGYVGEFGRAFACRRKRVLRALSTNRELRNDTREGWFVNKGSLEIMTEWLEEVANKVQMARI